MKRDLILTVDIGTTYCKAILWTDNGEILSQSDKINQVSYPKPSWAEIEPSKWWRNVQSAIRESLKKSGLTFKDGKLIAIGLASCRDVIIPIDGRGDPLGNAIIWLDKRASHQAAEIEEALGKEGVHKITGIRPDATFFASKLLWLKRHEAEKMEKCSYFLQPKDYIYYKLTGEIATDFTMASRTMMFDIDRGRWWSPICDFIEVNNSRLPSVFDPINTFHKIKKNIARRFGLEDEVKIVLGGGDRQCEALACGVSSVRAMDSTGTSTNISVTHAKVGRPYDPKLVNSLHVLPNEVLIECTIDTTGSILEWLKRLSGKDKALVEIIETEVRNVPPGAKGLLILPFFMGTRSVRWNSNAKGVIFGLTFGHEKKEIIRGIVEGIAFEEKNCLQVLNEVGFAIENIVVSGGGSRSDLWNQIKADITHAKVLKLRNTNAASFGAMILAKIGMGLLSDPKSAIQKLNPTLKIFHPKPETEAFYEKIYPIYQDFYNAIEPFFNRLSEIREYR
jgi:xylulokinase